MATLTYWDPTIFSRKKRDSWVNVDRDRLFAYDL